MPLIEIQYLHENVATLQTLRMQDRSVNVKSCFQSKANPLSALQDDYHMLLLV